VILGMKTIMRIEIPWNVQIYNFPEYHQDDGWPENYRHYGPIPVPEPWQAPGEAIEHPVYPSHWLDLERGLVTHCWAFYGHDRDLITGATPSVEQWWRNRSETPND